MRRTTSVLVAGILVAGLGACGDDDDDAASGGDGGDASSTTAPADAEGAGTAAPDFCEGFGNLDAAFADAPEDPAQVEAFIAEEVTPNLELIEANVPDEVSGGVGTMLAAAEEFQASGDMSAFETPEFLAAQGEVYPFLAEGCGWQELEVTAVDFAFEGVPERLDAGMTVITVENRTESGELHEIGLLKLADDADIALDDLMALSEEEAQQYLDPEAPQTFAFATPGEVGGTTVDLAPGRYVYACFIPTGTTLDAEGQGPPHFVEGMVGELTVA